MPRTHWADATGRSQLQVDSVIVGPTLLHRVSPQHWKGKQVFRSWSDRVTTATNPDQSATKPGHYTAGFPTT
jgi:hypothetical protein